MVWITKKAAKSELATELVEVPAAVPEKEKKAEKAATGSEKEAAAATAADETAAHKGLEEPVQPELNIGMVGHVDHGKCISKHESILINNRLIKGIDLVKLALKDGKKLTEDSEGAFYEVPGLNTYAFGKRGDIIRAPGVIYLQRYKGVLRKITTRTGRNITLTKSHPLLRNKNGNLEWVSSAFLNAGDNIAILKNLPLREGAVEIRGNYLSALSNNYWVITDKDASRFQKLISEGNLLKGKNVGQHLNVVRLLYRYSVNKFCREAGIDSRAYRRFVKSGKPLSAKSQQRLELFLRAKPIPEVPKRTIFLASKKDKMGTQWSALFKDLHVTPQLIRFIALLTAEGQLTKNRILLCQKVYPEILTDTIKFLENAGVKPKYVSEKDVHVNNRAFVDYLQAKFSLQTGASRQATIPSWLLSLPSSLKVEFLRTFFTVEANTNPHSLQIVLTQANKATINTISYMLLSFGIFPILGKIRKSATNSPEPVKRIYYTLTISGKDNLKAFKEQIGFEEARLRSALEKCITVSSAKKIGNVPVDMKQVSRLLWEVFRRKNSRSMLKLHFKKRAWYKGWEEAKKKGALSQDLWHKIKSDILVEADKIQASFTDSQDWKNITDIASISYSALAQRLNRPRTSLVRELQSQPKSSTLGALKSFAAEKISLIKISLDKIDALFKLPLLFDKIAKIESVYYNDTLIDLNVPKHNSFFAGYGGILCHNTTLVEAITGRWTDTHSEEIKRGITIRLGYADAAFRKCPKCPEPSAFTTVEKCGKCGEKTGLARKVSFVDAPGHESLMATMLSGSAIMDGALLLIAANEKCPQPQTREHLVALQIVGIKNVVIVQNKIDLVSEEQALENYKQIKEFIKGTPYESAPIVPISAQRKVNIDALIEAIIETIPVPQRKRDGEPLMLVARSFDINRPGTLPNDIVGGVLGGAVRQGVFSAGQQIEIRPGRRMEKAGKIAWLPIVTKITGLVTGGASTSEVGPGGSVGVQTSLDPGIVKADALAGTVVGPPGTLPPVWNEFKLEIHLLERVVGAKDELIVEPLKIGETLMLNVNSSATVGIVADLKKGASLIRLKLPVCAEAGSRVTLSRLLGSRWRLIGYGIINA